jgi:tRNA A37 threonylcarbamoyladenosine dehydratase
MLETPVEPDLTRRFGGVRRLYGEAGLARFQAAHICVIGIGGVGSWAAEALARNAVGRITLIDLDNIAESNVNRQLHAIEGEFGKAKVTAMAERIRAINPNCRAQEIEDFVTVENVATMLGHDFDGVHGFDGVIDAIDDARVKAAIAAYCRMHKLSLVMTGGAGGRFDPTQIKSADLAKTSADRLLAKVRTTLRRDYGFPKEAKAEFGIPCIYSDEPVIRPVELACGNEDDSITGLNCAGYGSSVCVTAPFGMAATATMLRLLLKL